MKLKTYSKGMRQRLGLAQALLGKPKLLILDEPTVGLDPIATQELYQLIGRLKDDGTSIIICSHVLPGVESYIDSAVVLARGNLIASGSLYQLREQAGLPVRIRVKGIEQDIADAGVVAHKQMADGWQELAVKPQSKLEVLGRLLAMHPLDVEVSPPSLEDLYRFYTEQAGAIGAAGVQQ